MSIIEQALDKLEDVHSPPPHRSTADDFMFSSDSDSDTFKLARRFFLWISLVMSTIIFLLVSLSDSTAPVPVDINRVERVNTINETTTRREVIATIENIEKKKDAGAASSWIREGWQWYENTSIYDAIVYWETHFRNLDSDTGLYISSVTHHSEAAIDALIRENTDPSRFFIRWPIGIGNQVMELCIQPIGMIVTKSHCSQQLSKKEKLVLKSDLSLAFYMRQQASPAPKKVETIVTKPRKKIAALKPIVSPINTPDLENVIPQQLDRGNFERVLELLGKHRHKLANAWEYYYWKSQAFAGLGRLDEAEKSLDIGITKNNNQSVLITQKGLLAQERGDHDVALALFKKADKLHSPPASLYLNMGYSAAVLGDTPLASTAYRQYLSMTDDDTNTDPTIRHQVKDYLRQIQ